MDAKETIVRYAHIHPKSVCGNTQGALVCFFVGAEAAPNQVALAVTRQGRYSNLCGRTKRRPPGCLEHTVEAIIFKTIAPPELSGAAGESQR